MPEKIVTKGLVLRETQTKEADKILTVLTAEHGRLAVVARGARRRNSRYAAACELLAYSELVLYERNGWQMLSEASTLELWRHIRRDVELLSLASYFAELAEAVSGEGEPAADTLSLLLNALYALDALDKPPEQVKAAYELRLLALSGYEPLVSACAACGATAPKDPCFDPRQGVVMCRDCAGGVAQGLLPLDPGSLAAMRHVLGAEPKRMLSFRLKGASQSRFSRACESFAQVQLERGFRTLDFYRSLQAGRKDFPGNTQDSTTNGNN
jgi:DNA repair protein RecO (recombination protein O)